MLARFDCFLRHRAFNPLARSIQRWFHVNRYHLLVATGIINIVFNATVNVAWLTIRVSENGGWSPMNSMMLAFILLPLAGWISTGYVAVYFRALREAARRFEESGFARKSPELVRHAMMTGLIRPFVNPVLPIVAVNMLLEWFVPGAGFDSLLWAAICQAQHFGAFLFLFDLHLWNVDDLDERDREYLFGPQHQESSAP